jgi:parallel beta-helix repeat protein
MKSIKSYLTLMLVLIFVFGSSLLFGQVSMTVNSLADDEYSYPWDDPNTPEDESRDGICRDELGRCTIRAAIEESDNMEVPVDLNFSVGGTIILTDWLYPYDGSELTANLPIEITSSALFSENGGFEINDNTEIRGFRFNDLLTAIKVLGNRNSINSENVFLNCYTALTVEGDSNYISYNRFGIDTNNVLAPNAVGIFILGGSNNYVEHNTVCGSDISGIAIELSNSNEILGNAIGTNNEGDAGLGNRQGIFIGGSDYNSILFNTISGNEVVGIGISGAPPDSYSSFNIIQYNRIGTDFGQEYAIPNGQGIVINNGARDEQIFDNTIAGNTLNGINIFGLDEETRTSGHFIQGNDIGITSLTNKIIPNGANGIDIWGSAEYIAIYAEGGSGYPNRIVGNQGKGIQLTSYSNFTPSKITVKKNLIYQNSNSNLFITPPSNDGILPPYGLSISNNTIAGIHDIPGSLIDIYKANINEFHASAYQWLGSTTVGGNGVFSYVITDPTVEAVSLTATDDWNTSGFAFLELITDVEKENDQIPNEYSLHQNYPNPFNPSTTITFSIPNEDLVSLKVFNSLGEEVADLLNETKPMGNYSVTFDASSATGGLTSGVYFYKISAGSFIQTKKMILVK